MSKTVQKFVTVMVCQQRLKSFYRTLFSQKDTRFSIDFPPFTISFAQIIGFRKLKHCNLLTGTNIQGVSLRVRHRVTIGTSFFNQIIFIFKVVIFLVFHKYLKTDQRYTQNWRNSVSQGSKFSFVGDSQKKVYTLVILKFNIFFMNFLNKPICPLPHNSIMA